MSGHDETSLTSFEAVAEHYLRTHALDAARDSEWFGLPSRSLAEAIAIAAESMIPARTWDRLVRHSHQRRIPGAVLDEARTRLIEAEHEINRCTDFVSLHRVVEDRIGAIPGVGELLVYDVAHRIGMSLGLAPRHVYLHAGTRRGARALGLSVAGSIVPLSGLPVGLGSLSAAQAEDALCIYRDNFLRLRMGEPATPPDGCGKTRRRARRPGCG